MLSSSSTTRTLRMKTLRNEMRLCCPCQAKSSYAMKIMQTGLDRLAATEKLRARLRDKRVGVLAHPASVDKHMRHIRSVLRAIDVKPAILFGPEHGYGGEAQDMIGVGDAYDADGVPIRSLYGARYSDLIPREEDLRGLDVLL